eukprot:CAMPEP_0167763146 /NCGR_PEP_ID=MMETSP0110_2-20121227/13185_1 /TAXON_ID=629695 /ORGANISM="Gymnochlora sp., Strain CCMP2014" /LENGTH=338 /DNA_ID=CAMNT_0007650147 /DNA_START=24 /DNA_END=1040 /DNA_ORIENTATION=-
MYEAHMAGKKHKKLEQERKYGGMVKFYCDICEVMMNSENDYESHMKGKIHQKNLKRRQDVYSYVNRSRYGSEVNFIELRAQNGQKPQLNNVEFFCKICEKFCTSKENMEAHLKGKAHKKKLDMLELKGSYDQSALEYKPQRADSFYPPPLPQLTPNVARSDVSGVNRAMNFGGSDITMGSPSLHDEKQVPGATSSYATCTDDYKSETTVPAGLAQNARLESQSLKLNKSRPSRGNRSTVQNIPSTETNRQLWARQNSLIARQADEIDRLHELIKDLELKLQKSNREIRKREEKIIQQEKELLHVKYTVLRAKDEEIEEKDRQLFEITGKYQRLLGRWQ